MDRVFRWIKRANSILFLLVLIGGAFGAVQLYVAYREMLASYTARNTPVFEEIESAEEPVRLSLGEADRVRGTDIVAIVLYSEEDAGSRRAGHRHEEMRNVLFLSDNGARWLFEKHTNVLLEFDELRAGEQPTLAFYYEIVQQSPVDDDKPIGENSLTIALSKADGSKLTEILTDVTRVLSHEQTDDHVLSIIYQIHGELWHARFDLNSFSKLSERPLVNVPQQM